MSLNRSYTVFLKGKEEVVDSQTLTGFRKLYLEGKNFKSRVSELFLLDLYICELEFGVSPLNIIEEIISLETGNSNGFTKAPSKFNRKPLKGLWHKHYFSAHFTTENIKIKRGRNGISDLIEQLARSMKQGKSKDDAMSEFMHDLFEKPLEERSEEKKITGEWIIYAKYNHKNYYLCLSTHQAEDQFIFDRIFNHGLSEFTFLKSVEPFSEST